MNTGFRLTPEMITRLVEGYQAGKTTTELGAEYKISKASVCRALRKGGIEPERKDNLFQDKEYTVEEMESICIDYRSGSNITEICKKHKTTYALVVKLLESRGLYKKKANTKMDVLKQAKTIRIGENETRKFLSADEIAEICEKYADGPQIKQDLAEEYNVHLSTITAVLNKAGIITKRYMDEDIIEAFCAEFSLGTSTVAELAKIYEKNPETLRYWLTKRGLIDTKESVVAQALTPSKAMTSAMLRQMARSESEASLQTLKDIRDNPNETGRTRAYAAQVIIERAFGKSKEETEEEKDTSSSTDKILKLVSKDLIKK